MSKIDCSTVVGFAHEASRVCEMYDDCGECPFSGRKRCPMVILEYDKPDVQAIVDALQKWSDEHPQKTRMEDLLKRYPNIETYSGSGPAFAPYRLGYCNNCINCHLFGCGSLSNCWHEPVDGGATGKAVENI